MFSWIDTEDDNFPPVLPKELVPIAFELFSQIMPSVIDAFFLQAMNQRLGTKGLGFKKIAVEAAKLNKTIHQLMAEPELDGWWYTDGYSYVWSCLVVGLYKAADLFGDMEINAVEFTPKDLYQIDLFNTTAVLPSQCKAADPDLPFCQILGKYKVSLPGYSTITPYPTWMSIVLLLLQTTLDQMVVNPSKYPIFNLFNIKLLNITF